MLTQITRTSDVKGTKLYLYRSKELKKNLTKTIIYTLKLENLNNCEQNRTE